MKSEETANDSNPQQDTAARNNASDHEPGSSVQTDHDRYRLFIEEAIEGFYEIDQAGNFVFFNDAFCRIFGRSRPEMANRNYAEFMDNENANFTASRLQQIRDSDSVTRITWKIIRKGGQTRTLDVSVRPILDPDGHHIGFRGMARDVTHKIQTQKAVSESKKKIKKLYIASQKAERRYRTFLEFLPLPLVVQNNDLTVAYINPAFQKTFGWTLEDLELNPFAHIPDDRIFKTRTGKLNLLHNVMLSGIETKCITKDGRVLDVKSYGSVFYDQENHPEGMVIALRNLTRSKKNAKTSEALFKIAKALHHYGGLDSRLAYISKQVQNLLQTENAHIILIDRERNEYYFRAGAMNDTNSYHTLSQTRVPLDDTYFAGRVILSAKSQIINNVPEKRIRLIIPNNQVENLIGVPMELGSRVIGAMVASNKIGGKFDQEDVVLLSSIARMVALPIENARINDELRDSYEEIKALNRAKDRIIDHLSHELRTPLSILSASLDLLPINDSSDPATKERILARCQRNLKRITAMQSKLVDIIRDPDQETHKTLLALLELCTDELESLADAEIGPDAGQRIRQRLDELFKPREMQSQHLSLGPFVQGKIEKLKPAFAHRQVEVTTAIHENAGYVNLPAEVLSKIITGLLRNAVEYTPDGGKIKIEAAAGKEGPELTVADTGVGITQENQQLIFGNYFTTTDISRYGTAKPYDFNAGGSGFDLLRMRVFSERYHFKILLHSKRCRHIPTNADICPGSTRACIYCNSPDHCHHSGGTRFTIQFSS